MSDAGAAGIALGPKPDKRGLGSPFCLHCQSQQPFVKTVHSAVNRPMRKWDAIPTAQAESLQVLAHINRHDRPQQIVESVKEAITILYAAFTVSHVLFQAKIRDHF